MSRTIIVRPEAEADLREAFAWYEQQREGLGQEFMDKVEQAFAMLADSPTRYPMVRRNTRRALVRRFPYSIYFVQKGDTILVLGVLHQRRNPEV